MLLTDRALHDAHADLARALWAGVWVSWDVAVPTAEARLTDGGRVRLRQEAGGWSVRVADSDEDWVHAALAHAFGEGPDPGPPPWVAPVGEDLAGWTNDQVYAGSWWAKAGVGRGEGDVARAVDFIEDDLALHLPESGPWVELQDARWEAVEGGWGALPTASWEPALQLVLDAWRRASPEVRAVRSEEGTALVTDEHVLLVFRS